MHYYELILKITMNLFQRFTDATTHIYCYYVKIKFTMKLSMSWSPQMSQSTYAFYMWKFAQDPKGKFLYHRVFNEIAIFSVLERKNSLWFVDFSFPIMRFALWVFPSVSHVPLSFSREALVPSNVTILFSYHISNRKLKMRKFVFSACLKKVPMNFMLFAEFVFIWLNNMFALKRQQIV